MKTLSKLSLVTIFGLGMGCSGDETVQMQTTYTGVMQQLRFAGEEPKGIAFGFNLDGYVSTERDDRACSVPDFASPNGEEGIDNQLATLLPIIDLAAEGALQALLQTSVNEGRLLIFIELNETVEGGYHVRLRRGEDTPLLGTDGYILPSQTMALHIESELGETSKVTREGNVFTAGPFNFLLPAQVFEVLYIVNLRNAMIRFEVTDEGFIKGGVAGGGIELPELFKILSVADQRVGPNNSLEKLLGDAVREFADLERGPDGKCNQISVSMQFEGVPAYIWE